MLSRRLPALLCLLSTLFSAGNLRADENAAAETDAKELHTLVYKFQTGEEIRWQTLHRATIKTTIRGTTQTAQTSTDSFKRWKILNISPEGDITFVHLVDQVKMINKISGRAEVKFDSTKDKKVPGFENIEAAIGVPLAEITMNEHGKVSERIQKLVQPKGNFEPPIAIPLPVKPVPVGATWNEPHSITVELADKRKKDIQVRRHFELTKVFDGIAHIDVKFQVLSPLNDPAIEAQIIQHSSQGNIRFDIENGRVISQSIAVDKRVLGFSGPASSMHYLMQVNETLADGSTSVASRPQDTDEAPPK